MVPIFRYINEFLLLLFYSSKKAKLLVNLPVIDFGLMRTLALKEMDANGA